MEDENYLELRRPTCTPDSEALRVLIDLAGIWNRWFPGDSFIDRFFKPMWLDDKTSGLDQISQLNTLNSNPMLFEGRASTLSDKFVAEKFGMVMVVCAFCVQAMKTKDLSSEAWSYAVDAAQWLGGIQGQITTPSGYQDPLSKLAGLGAHVRHTENRAMKNEIHEWLDANMPNFKSMDSAAEAIAGKIAPVKFRTARDWVTEWKKLRSTGTP